MGVLAKGTSIQCYISDSLATLWDPASKKFDTTDSDHSSGQCGLISVGSHGRFTDVRLEEIGDLHVPSDQIQLSAFSLFRTIYPFHEDAP